MREAEAEIQLIHSVQAEESKHEIQSLTNEINNFKAHVRKVEDEANLLRQDLANKQEQIQLLNEEKQVMIQRERDMIAAKDSQIEQLQRQLEESKLLSNDDLAAFFNRNSITTARMGSVTERCATGEDDNRETKLIQSTNELNPCLKVEEKQTSGRV